MYTGWNMTCSPRANRLYTARERAAGRQQGRGKVARLARIQKSKNSGSWCAKAFYCTKYKYLVNALHRTNFRGTIEPKKFGKSTSKEHTKGNWYKRTSGFSGLNLFFEKKS